MDDPSRQQGSVHEEEGVDLISELDEKLRAKILSYLPIKDAIRTNALSTKWRYTWTIIPDLAITETNFSVKLPQNRSKLINFIDRLFLLHQGPIRTFKLSTDQNCHGALDRWVRILSTYEISELTLELTSKRKHKLNSSFFSCKNLSSIYLCNCLVKLPQNYEGFEVLSVLKLKNCSLTGAEIERFVCKCPLLKDLSLSKFREGSGLKIEVPNLKRLSIDGSFTDLQLFTPKLTKVCIDLEKNPSGEGCVPKGGCGTNFSRAFCGAPRIETLRIHRHFLQYLAQGNFLEENQVPTIFPRLKVLTLDIDLSSLLEIRAALFLFTNAPTLEDLDVVNYQSLQKSRRKELWSLLHETVYWLEEYEKIRSISQSKGRFTPASLIFFFEHLKNVSVKGFALTNLNFKFLSSILGSSPLLQTLTVSSEKPDYNKEALVLQLCQLRRASDFVNISHL